VITFTDVTSDLNALIGTVSVPPLGGCGSTREADVVWPDLAPGVHRMRIEVGASNSAVEPSKTNNVLTTTVVVGTNGVYLPLIAR
jgi:hypothetical protein